MRNSRGNTKVREEGGGGGVPGVRADIPLQAVEETMLEQIFTAAHGVPRTRAAGYFLKELQPVEKPTLEHILLIGIAACGEPTLEQFFS